MELKHLTLLLFIGNSICSCSNDTELKELKDSLRSKEMQLASLYERLKIKDDSLRLFNSTLSKDPTDSAGAYKPELIGLWSAKMQCIETSCEGSAIGDIKNEQWEMSYQGTMLIAKAITDNKVTRTYSGYLKNEYIELESNEPGGTTLMTVRLQTIRNDEKLEGIREILRGENCRIRYSVTLEKL